MYHALRAASAHATALGTTGLRRALCAALSAKDARRALWCVMHDACRRRGTQAAGVDDGEGGEDPRPLHAAARAGSLELVMLLLQVRDWGWAAWLACGRLQATPAR